MAVLKIVLFFIKIVLLVFLCFQNLTFGQSIEWEKTYGESANREYCQSIVACSDGGFVLVGFNDGGGFTYDIVFVKISNDGDSLWGKRYGLVNELEIPFDIVLTKDSGFMICGTATCGNSCSDIYSMRLDSFGDSLWTRRYGGAFGGQGNAIVQTEDSGFAIAGIIRDSSPSDIKGALLRINKNGDSLSCLVFGNNQNTITLEDIIILSGGDLLVSGHRSNSDSSFYDIFASRVNNAGVLQWEKFYGDADNQNSLSSTLLNNNTVLFAGYRFLDGDYDCLILNIGLNGDSLWSNMLGDALSNICSDVISTADGGFIFCGSRSQSSPRIYDMVIVKYDSSYNLKWSLDTSLSYEVHANRIREAIDTGFIVAGYMEIAGGGLPLDLWVAKINGPPCCNGIRGDVNGDGPDANILDLTYLVDFIFRGSGNRGPCPEESDVNGDGAVANILDLTFLVDVIFRGGPIPPACAK